jgi:hypothetical protein
LAGELEKGRIDYVSPLKSTDRFNPLMEITHSSSNYKSHLQTERERERENHLQFREAQLQSRSLRVGDVGSHNIRPDKLHIVQSDTKERDNPDFNQYLKHAGHIKQSINTLNHFSNQF